MSEGIALDELARGTLLGEREREARLALALPQIEAVLAGETDVVALQATLACLFFQTFAHANFCGFYRRVGERTLVIGPYQGSMGCLRIDFSRGVCGAAARTNTIQRVADVHAFPGHIACDDRSRSELVVPIATPARRGHPPRVRAVLDVDSPHADAFSAREAALVEAFFRRVFDRDDVAW